MNQSGESELVCYEHEWSEVSETKLLRPFVKYTRVCIICGEVDEDISDKIGYVPFFWDKEENAR